MFGRKKAVDSTNAGAVEGYTEAEWRGKRDAWVQCENDIRDGLSRRPLKVYAVAAYLDTGEARDYLAIAASLADGEDSVWLNTELNDVKVIDVFAVRLHDDDPLCQRAPKSPGELVRITAEASDPVSL